MRSFGLFLVLALVSACNQAPTVTLPTPTPTPVEPGLVVVDKVEILRLADDPTQVRAAIYGKLPDACSQLDTAKVEKTGDRFQVTLMAARAPGASCLPGAVAFERVVTLDTVGMPAGVVTVSANGISAGFAMAAEPSQAAAGATSTTPAAPTEAPAEPVISATPAPGEVVTVAGQTPNPPDCADKAAFYGDVTVLDGDSFKQSQPFTKTWRIRNEGSCVWGPDYALVFAGGDQLSGPLSKPMPAIAPGETGEVSVDLVAPPVGGEFTSYWQFQNPKGVRFGVNASGKDLIWAKIGVSFYVDTTGQVSSPAEPKPTPVGCAPDENAGYLAQIETLINQARAANGLAPLSVNGKLSSAAQVHSVDMACQDFINHAGSDGSTWNTRIAAQGYNYAYASENIYVGNPSFGGTPQGAFDWWMNSQIHRDNILSTKVTEIGIGYAYWAQSTYGGYYTLNFAKPK